MTFEERLRASAGEIEAALGVLLAGRGDVPGRLEAAMRHAVLAGGKRIRPFLLIETAALFDVAASSAMPAAFALECVHCYSLAHDDLPAMDNDEVRRGKPTVWRAFGEWTAILAGDGLLTLAFELVAGMPGDAARNGRLVAELARAAGGAGMVGGQCLDLEADKLSQPDKPDIAHIERLQALKTGALFRFACQAGAILGRASRDEEQALTRFGDKLGAAFQLADDLLDADGEAAIVGKATGKDAAAGKATLIELLGMETARQRLRDIEVAALTEIAAFGPRADVLRETLRFAVARRS